MGLIDILAAQPSNRKLAPTDNPVSRLCSKQSKSGLFYNCFVILSLFQRLFIVKFNVFFYIADDQFVFISTLKLNY